MRTGAAAAAFDVETDRGAEEIESERDSQDEDQRGNGPEQVSLLQAGRSEGTEIEGPLPDDERHQNREQQDAGAEDEAFTHGPDVIISAATWGAGPLVGR